MMPKSIFLACLAIGISMSLGACTSRVTGSDQILIIAQEVYFGGPNDKHVAAKRELIRWNGPVRASIEGPGADDYRDRVAGYLEDFTRLTKLDASLVDEPGGANLAIVLSDGDSYEINGERAPCYARFGDSDGAIQRVDIRIGVTDPSKIEDCLAHEIYHAFGLRFHSTAAESVLSSVHGKNRPTPADELALSILYDPRLRPGAEFPELAAILDELTSKVTGDFGHHWAAVLPAASRIEILQNADDGYVSRYLRTRYPTKHINIDYAYWRGPGAFRPSAVVILNTAERGYFIDNLPPLKEGISKVGWLSGKTLQFGEQAKHKGHHGLLDTVKFRLESLDNTECLGFRQRLMSYPTIGSGSTDLLIGYLCANPGGSLDMKLVGGLLQSVKIRGI